jgi:hypothetical protein
MIKKAVTHGPGFVRNSATASRSSASGPDLHGAPACFRSSLAASSWDPIARLEGTEAPMVPHRTPLA